MIVMPCIILSWKKTGGAAESEQLLLVSAEQPKYRQDIDIYILTNDALLPYIFKYDDLLQFGMAYLEYEVRQQGAKAKSGLYDILVCASLYFKRAQRSLSSDVNL